MISEARWYHLTHSADCYNSVIAWICAVSHSPLLLAFSAKDRKQEIRVSCTEIVSMLSNDKLSYQDTAKSAMPLQVWTDLDAIPVDYFAWHCVYIYVHNGQAAWQAQNHMSTHQELI